MSHIIEINDFDQLATCRLLWNSLLPQTRGASFFQSFDWLSAYWKHFGQAQKLRVLIVNSDDRPIGILPLCVRVQRHLFGTLRVLTYPLHDWGTYYGPIGPNPTATLLGGMRYIRQTARDWDLVDLRWIDTEHLDRGRTDRAMQAVGLRPVRQPWRRTAAINLSGTWEQYCATRTTRWQNEYRRNQQLLENRGKVELIRYRPLGQAYGDGDPRWDLYDACEELARRSEQGSAPDYAALSHTSERPFLREAHALAARRGMLDLVLLTVGDQPAAFAYNYHYEGNVSGLRGGFDPAFSAEGVGNVLWARAIRDSFERGDTWYDLGPGSLSAKQPFYTHLETSYHCTHFPRSGIRAQLLRARRWWARRGAEETAANKN